MTDDAILIETENTTMRYRNETTADGGFMVLIVPKCEVSRYAEPEYTAGKIYIRELDAVKYAGLSARTLQDNLTRYVNSSDEEQVGKTIKAEVMHSFCYRIAEIDALKQEIAEK